MADNPTANALNPRAHQAGNPMKSR
jgi:hypothetical protein